MREIKKVYGPYERPDGRKHVIILYTNEVRETVSYPKYLMEQHLGRKLEDWETVDHINENMLDDRIENLQVLSRPDNSRKSAVPAETITFVCPVCGKKATKPARFVRHNLSLGSAGPFCGRVCAGKYSKSIQNKELDVLIKQIKKPE